MVGMRRIFEAFRLLAVNDFRKISMEESIFNVELMDRPPGRYSEGEDDANGTRFNYR
jgi:hypothetical protein